jgi:ATP-dependent Clp protease ATP-binding subunit ClpC
MGPNEPSSALFVSDESAYSDVIEDRGLGGEALQLFTHLNGRVIGQERACTRVASSLSTYYAGLGDPVLPIGSYIFAGPTGVGKTELAKELARFLIADLPNAPLTKIEGGNNQERHELAKLKGSPPGYVKSDELGLLAQCKIDEAHFWVKADPYIKGRYKAQMSKEKALGILLDLYPRLWPYFSVILFDEIEKAHPGFWNMLLHILGDGTLAMDDGSITSFANSVIMLTCNVGGVEQQSILKNRNPKVGFKAASPGEEEDKDQKIYEDTVRLIDGKFPPELVGRLRKSIIVFRTLGRHDCAKVLSLMLSGVQGMMTGRVGSKSIPLTIRYSDSFKEYLLDEGIDQTFGLRPLKATIQRKVVEPLANCIASGQLIEADEVLFTLEDPGGDPKKRKPVLRRKPRLPPLKVDQKTATASSSTPLLTDGKQQKK